MDVIVVLIILFLLLSRGMPTAMMNTCIGVGISSGCGPGALIIGSNKVVAPGFTGSNYRCAPSTTPSCGVQQPILIPTGSGLLPSSVQPRPVFHPPMAIAPQATSLPTPMAMRPSLNRCAPQLTVTPRPAQAFACICGEPGAIVRILAGYKQSGVIRPTCALTLCFYNKFLAQNPNATAQQKTAYAVVANEAANNFTSNAPVNPGAILQMFTGLAGRV